MEEDYYIYILYIYI